MRVTLSVESEILDTDLTFTHRFPDMLSRMDELEFAKKAILDTAARAVAALELELVDDENPARATVQEALERRD